MFTRRNLLSVLCLGLLPSELKSEENPNQIRFWNKTIDVIRREQGLIVEWRESCDNIHTYYKKGLIHNNDGPAVIEYGEQYKIITEAWYKDGVFLRGQSYGAKA
jgi:hypothetical protein